MSSSDSFSLAVWDWIAAIGVWVVIIGIVGEGAELFVKLLKKRRLKKFQRDWDDGFRRFMAVLAGYVRTRELEVETIAFVMVVAGLMAEFWGGQESQQILDKNNAQLYLESKNIGTTNAMLYSNNIVLQTKLLELEVKIRGRWLSPDEMADGKAILSGLSCSPIYFCVQPSNDEEVGKIYGQLRELTAMWGSIGTQSEMLSDANAISVIPKGINITAWSTSDVAAATQLSDFLKKCQIATTLMLATNDQMPRGAYLKPMPDHIFILVGPRP